MTEETMTEGTMTGDDGHGVSRRQFLRRASLGAGALGVGLHLPTPLVGAQRGPAPPAAPEGPPPPERPSGRAADPQRVLVVGAGLAGLAAARELEAAGHEVTVLEARSRPGGRVMTLREPFAEGLYADAGAVAFSEAYTEAVRYIDDLGLERAPWEQADLAALYHLRGERIVAGPDDRPDWPYDLTEREAKLGPMGLLQEYLLGTVPEAVSEPGRWSEPPLVELDEVTLGEYMRSRGASGGAVDLIRDTQWFGYAAEHGSMLSSALAEFGLFYAGAPFVLAGGNDRLPFAMAEALEGRIHYGVEATALRDTGREVRVRAVRGDREETHRADRVVCTVPLGVLRGIDVEPRMPRAKRTAVSDMPYIDATRTFVQVGRAFWHDEGVAGSAATDLPVGVVFRQPLADAAGPDRRSLLEAYTTGPAATRQDTLSEDELVEGVLEGLAKVHPGIREHFEGAVVRSWGRDPHAVGHVSWPDAGDVTAHLEDLQRPHGRIHFAGEHTTVLRGTMEGALRSGIRAATEVHEGAA